MVRVSALINIDRVDFFFTTEEVAAGIFEAAGLKKPDYKYINFSNMPPGNKRYILCSMQVKEETIKKLNA